MKFENKKPSPVQYLKSLDRITAREKIKISVPKDERVHFCDSAKWHGE